LQILGCSFDTEEAMIHKRKMATDVWNLRLEDLGEEEIDGIPRRRK
jgi:hypothetical protein